MAVAVIPQLETTKNLETSKNRWFPDGSSGVFGRHEGDWLMIG